jgi:hypothetical protein
MIVHRGDDESRSEEEERLLAWRVLQLERAVETMADAAERQQEFNVRVERFMAKAQTWGAVALLTYGLGQAALIAVLAERL